jgi:methionyl-tRNA formyltransferase
VKLRVFISGQKYFGEEVLRLCLNMGLDVVGVCCPRDDKYIGRLARLNNVPTIAAGTLTAETMPDGVDLGITAHSFDYIGKATRYKARLGWIGYHPSLLPRHRGRSSIEWALRMGDQVTGGTVFWLNAGIDRGDIAYQDWCWIDPASRVSDIKRATKELWQDTLLPMGVRLLKQALNDIASGVIIKMPQDARFSTFEPCTEVKDIFKPDLLMLEQRCA